MKKDFLGLGMTAVCSSILLTGCIDDAYDLSDINTETEIRVNDLVLPVNIDQLTLNDVINVKPGDKIQKVNGQYAVLVEGKFESKKIRINPIDIEKPHLTDNVETIGRTTSNSQRRKASGVQFTIPTYSTTFSYRQDHVDEAIKSIESVMLDNFSISIDFSVPELRGKATEMTITDLKITLPTGLITDDSRYNPTTGLFSVSEVTGAGADIKLNLPVEGIKLDGALDGQTHKFDYSGSIQIESGILHADADASTLASLPSTVELHTQYEMSRMDVVSATGDLSYVLDSFNIEPIDLSDLPTFLSQKGTNLILNNPQIYLQVNNPMGLNGATASTALKLVAEREGESPKTFELDNGTFGIGDNMGVGPYQFCLSPRTPEQYYEGFENAKHEGFTDLSYVIAGDGLPRTIDVKADNSVFEGHPVKNLPIGRDIDPVGGKYVFYAPLALDATSSVVYSDRADGWGSEDLDALTIEKLEITANISTDINTSVRLTGYPIDTNNNPIYDAEIEEVIVPANADNYAVTIHTTGVIKNLDGFVYEVTAKTEDGVTLTPDQHIVLKNIRAKVSGKYVKEF